MMSISCNDRPSEAGRARVRAAPGDGAGEPRGAGPREEAGAQEGAGNELPRLDRQRQELRE